MAQANDVLDVRTPTAKKGEKRKHTPNTIRNATQKQVFKSYLDDPFASPMAELSDGLTDNICTSLASIVPMGVKSKKSIAGLTIGINSVSRCVEKGKASVVVLHYQFDNLICQHLVRLCRSRNVPCFSSQHLATRISSIVCLKKVSAVAFSLDLLDAAAQPAVQAAVDEQRVMTSNSYIPDKVKRLKAGSK